MKPRRRIPLAVKAGVFATGIAVGATALLAAVGMRVTEDGIDRRYEQEAHELTKVIVGQVRRRPDDFAAANRLLSDIVRTHPNLVRVRLFRAGPDGAPLVWASSYGTDLAVDAGGEVLPEPGQTRQIPVSIGDAEAFLNAETVALPNAIRSAAFYFDNGQRTEAMRDTRRSIIVGAAGVILVELLAIAVASYVLVLRRVKRLSRTARAVADGDLSARAGPDPHGWFADELSETMSQFDEMVGAVEARTRQQTAVARLGRLALGSLAVPELLDLAAETVAGTLAADVVSVFQRGSDGLDLRAARGWPDGAVGHTRLPVGDGSQSGWTLLTGEPTIMEDRDVETRFHVSAQSDELGLVSGVTVAIGGPFDPFGVLAAHQRSPRRFTPDDLSFLTTVANVLAEALERDASLAREREAEERYRLVVDNAAEMISLTDASGLVLFASPSHRQGLGIAPDSLLGTSLLTVVASAEKDRLEMVLDQVLAGASVTLPELRLRHADGHPVWVDLTSAPVRSAGGDLVLHVAHDVTDRREAQEERRRLLAQIMGAQEEERQKIAGDLHDDPIQTMTAATLRLEAVRNLATDPRQRELIGRLETTISDSIERLRHLMFELRPPALDRDGLLPALRDHVATIAREHGVMGEVGGRTEDELDPDGRAMAYRIAKEAIMNVVKHAGARRLWVTVDGDADGARISVRDDGCGFDPGAIERRHDHLGLDAMRERARVSGGWFRIDSAPERGTTVEYYVPRQGPATISAAG